MIDVVSMVGLLLVGEANIALPDDVCDELEIRSTGVLMLSAANVDKYICDVLLLDVGFS
jgi:hypothetical protein